MSYSRVVHVQHEQNLPPGYPQDIPPPPGFPNPSADYPPPPPRPGYPSPYPHELGYQGYFYDGYQQPLSVTPPPLRPYNQYRQDDYFCDSFLQTCLAALCCCCLLENCCP